MSATYYPADDDSWPYRAGCRGLDTELWFPIGTNPPDPYVKSVCEACPVRTECLEFALSHPQAAAAGVWGGMTEDQRAKERKNRQRRGAAERAVA